MWDEDSDARLPLHAWHRSDAAAWTIADDGRMIPVAPCQDLCSDVALLRKDASEVRRSSRAARAEAVRIVALSQRQRRRLASPLHLVVEDPDPE
jgi:hypothetical protein